MMFFKIIYNSIYKEIVNFCLDSLFIIYLILLGLMGRVFANGPGDLDSIPGHVIPKTQKMVLDIALLNT